MGKIEMLTRFGPNSPILYPIHKKRHYLYPIFKTLPNVHPTRLNRTRFQKWSVPDSKHRHIICTRLEKTTFSLPVKQYSHPINDPDTFRHRLSQLLSTTTKSVPDNNHCYVIRTRLTYTIPHYLKFAPFPNPTKPKFRTQFRPNPSSAPRMSSSFN